MCLHKLPLKLEKSSRTTAVSEEHDLEVGGNDKPPELGEQLGAGEKQLEKSQRCINPGGTPLGRGPG